MSPDLNFRLQSLLQDRYTLDRELGGGGMSRLFLATESAPRRPVVVKVLPPELVSATSLSRFAREIELMAALQHPNILPVLTAGGAGDLAYYISPYVEGESLRARLTAPQPMPFDACLRLAGELFDAVAFAHRCGIVHRDIKPGNVLLSQGHAVLADFGIARLLEQPNDGAVPSLTHEPSSPFIAPEGIGTERADQYAAAALVAAMLVHSVREVPADRATLAAAIGVRHPGASAGQIRQIAAALARALDPDPDRRWPSVTNLASSFNAIDGRLRARRMALAGAAVAVGVVAILAMTALQPSETRGIASSPALPPAPAETETASAPAEPTSAVTPPATALRLKPPVDSAALAFDEMRVSDAARLYEARVGEARLDATANARLAIVLGWLADSSRVELLRGAAARALADSAHLTPHDVAMVHGAVAMSERRFPDACAAYERARAAKADFGAWFGLAECRASDDLVVIDSSGAHFRGSHAEAMRAYASAVRAAGIGQARLGYSRLQRRAFIEPGRVRSGRDATGATWVGTPQLEGDTVTFHPWKPGPRRPPAGESERTERAIAAGRKFIRPLFIEWTRVSPSESAAHEALALVLEYEGQIAAAGPDGRTALAEVASARRTVSDVIVGDRLARAHVRMLLRTGDFRRAGVIADSTMRLSRATGDGESSGPLLSLAALTGRAERATALLEQMSGDPNRGRRAADGSTFEIPVASRRLVASFTVHSALGVCDAETKAAPPRLAAALDAMLPASRRGPAIDQTLLEVPIGLALDCAGIAASKLIERPSLPPLAAARALAEGRREEAISRLGILDEMRERGGPSLNPEWAVMEANVRLALGDSAGATRALQRMIDGLPTAPANLIASEFSAASVPRAMAILAELAMARGDRTTARRHAAAVTAMWGNADAVLAPIVQSMRRITEASSPAAPAERPD